MKNKILLYSFYLLFCCFVCSTTASLSQHCKKDDQNCHLIAKQSAVIAKYENEISKYHSILAVSNCSICNINGTNPCLNGGTCTVLDKYTYVCQCPDEYSGIYCEHHQVCGPPGTDCPASAICTVFNHNKVCSCPMGYTGDPRYGCNVKIARGCIRGDPHYSTFDGSYFTYMGTCPYTITQTYDNSFNLTGYNSFRRQSNSISYLTSFELFTKNTNFEITSDLKLYVNGIRHFFPHYYPSLYNPIVKITKWFDHVKIHDYSTGAIIDYKSFQLCISVPQSNLFYGTGKTGGVLGDIDGICTDDYRFKNGTVLNIPCNQGSSAEAAIFADSWVTNPNYNNCVLGKIIQNNTHCDTSDAQLQCSSIRDAISGIGPFAKCQHLTTNVIQQYFEDCVFDVCQGYDRCDILDGFATSCLEQLPFTTIDAWRDLTNCPWACPQFSSYSLQTPICQNTCADPNYSNSSSCHDGYQEGCKCWPGYYLDSVGDNTFSFACRRLHDCGCTDSYGNYYPPNTHWMNGNCTVYNQCTDGKLTSQPVICSINGECDRINGEPTCQCLPGYSGDGYACNDINECNDSTVCNANIGHGVCVNTPGSFYCQCIDPWGGIDCSLYQPKRHCADWYVYNGAHINGIYNISIGQQQIITSVYCDMETNGGGWTLASHGNSSAGKTYEQYINGFGNVENQDLWLGLENLYLMTNQTQTSLRVVIERCRVNNVPDTTRECTYPTFAVLPSNIGYPVYIPELCSNGNETIFDGFDGWIRWPRNETGPIFTSFDRDSTPYNCSAEYKNTGWWYYDKQAGLCGAANLNGLRQACNDNFLPQGYLTWHYDPVEDARMYLRPFNYPNYDTNAH